MVEPLIDLRSMPAYVLGHPVDACHLPFSELILRRHELPLPGTALRLLHDVVDELQQAHAMLIDWGYPVAAALQFDAALAQQWQQQARWQTGRESQQLWQASDCLQRALKRVGTIGNLPNERPLWALDLACGSGRDALTLAQHGFRVLAVDAKVDALERLQASARARDLDIAQQCLDLETGNVVLAQPAFALINVARYLHRPLLPQLRHWLQPGGWLVYETFLQGAERFGGPRRPAFLLAPGELAGEFAEFTILHDSVLYLADGRPMQQFIARKPG